MVGGMKNTARRFSSRATLGVALMATTAIAGAATASPAAAQVASADRRFEIPAQPLPQALMIFGRQSGLQVTAQGDLTKGLNSATVSGQFAPAEALSRLLVGTGLTYRFVGATGVQLERAPQARGAINLGPVRVEADATGAVRPSPAQAEIGAQPPAYAGGQVARGAKAGLLGNRDIFDIPLNITSFTAETIRNQQAHSIGDVLANDPSVRNAYPRGGEIDEFTIRGFTVYNREIAFAGLFGILPSETISAELADRVELIKGPNALLNGISPANSVGGGINVQPKRAEETPLTQLTAGYMSDSIMSAHVDVGRRFGADQALGVRVNAVYRGGDFALDHSRQSWGLAAIGIDYRGERARLSFDGGYQSRDLDAPQMLLLNFLVAPVPKAPDARTNFFQPWTYRDTRDLFGAARAEYDLTPDVTAYAAIGGKDSDSQSVQTNWSLRDGAGTIRVSPYHAKDYRKAVTGEAGVRARFATGAVEHALAVSGSMLDQESGETSTTTPFIFSNIYAPVTVPRPEFAALGSVPRTSEVTLSSIAIADTLSFAGDAVQLTLGVRRQRVETRNFSAITGAATSSYDKSATTPMVGLVFKPRGDISIYGNYIEGLSQGPVAPSNTINAGEVFPPFKSKQYEGGIKADLNGLGATLSLFRITRPNSFSRPISATDSRLIFGLDGEQRNQGVELNVFGEAAPGVRLLGGGAYTDAKLRRTRLGVNEGNRAGGVPKWQFNVGGEWDVVANVTLTGRIIHTGQQYMDAANTMAVPRWTRLDVGARYEFLSAGRPITLRLNVENLLGKDYWASGSRETLYQGAPRTVMLSATVDF